MTRSSKIGKSALKTKPKFVQFKEKELLKDSENLTYLYDLYGRVKTKEALMRADAELERLSTTMSEDERRTAVKIALEAGNRIKVTKRIIDLGKFGRFGTESANM